MAENQAQGHRDLAQSLRESIRTLDADYKEEGRELRQLFADALHETEKDEPDSAKLKALLGDANEAARTVATLDPVWYAVQSVAKMFGLL